MKLCIERSTLTRIHMNKREFARIYRNSQEIFGNKTIFYYARQRTVQSKINSLTVD